MPDYVEDRPEIADSCQFSTLPLVTEITYISIYHHFVLK